MTPRHHVEFAVRFSEPSCLLLDGWMVRSEAEPALELLSTSSGWNARPFSCAWFRREDVERETPGGVGFFALIELEPEEVGPFHLVFRGQGSSRALGNAIEPEPFHDGLRARLGSLLAAQRGLVPPALVMHHPRRMELLTLAAAPPRDISESAGLTVERILVLPDESRLVCGWCYAEHGIKTFEVLEARGRRLSDVLSDGVFFPREDVAAALSGRQNVELDRLGFVVRVEPGTDSEQPGRAAPALVCLETLDEKLYGVDLSTVPGEAIQDSRDIVARLVDLIPRQSAAGREEAFVERCLGPSLIGLRTYLGGEPLLRERRYGTLPEHPEVAIVIVASTEPRWLRYRLAAFADNPELGRCDLVYVVPDPASEAAIAAVAADIQPHFGVGFRLLVVPNEIPPAAALNAAARQARGAYLCLMDARVLPRGRFVTALTAAHAGTAAAVAPKLVTAEGTLEVGPPDLGPRANRFFADGLPDVVVDLAEPCPVEVLSTACLLVERERFLATGGLVAEYWQPGFADLDLCERLKVDERRLYLVPGITMDCLRDRPAWATSGSTLPRGDESERLQHYDSWLLRLRAGSPRPST